MMPLLQPTTMLVVNGSGCLRQASSCGAGAWAWAVATSDVTHPVSLWDICFPGAHWQIWNSIFTSPMVSLTFILSIIRVVPRQWQQLSRWREVGPPR